MLGTKYWRHQLLRYIYAVYLILIYGKKNNRMRNLNIPSEDSSWGTLKVSFPLSTHQSRTRQKDIRL